MWLSALDDAVFARLLLLSAAAQPAYFVDGSSFVIASGWQAPLQAGGLTAISRWLSEERAIPPVCNENTIRIPEGCQRTTICESAWGGIGLLRSLRDRILWVGGPRVPLVPRATPG